MAKAKVVKLPVPRFTFKAAVIDEAKVLAKYDRMRVCVATCLHMLKMSPKAMKKQVAALSALLPGYPVMHHDSTRPTRKPQPGCMCGAFSLHWHADGRFRLFKRDADPCLFPPHNFAGRVVSVWQY